ncbi:MAG: Kelch repeat-containing protein, partial [Candidatus Binataceae bacterium]
MLLADTNAVSSGISLNPLSAFVDSRSIGLMKGGAPFSTALNDATTEIEAIYGLKSDPGSLTPSYVATGTDAANLGLILGAIINEDQYLCPGSPGGLVTALAADISDGVFDGTTAGTPVTYCSSDLPAIAGTIDFQDALSALAQLDDVTAAFIFGGTGNILTTNGLADLALNGLNTYPIAPLATINQAIAQAAPSPLSTFAPPSAVPTMAAASYDAASTQLPGGNFMIAGGGGSSGVFLDSIELYDPATNTFASSTSTMNSLRANETATLLPNGKVLIAGGAVDNSTWTNTTDLYDPVTNSIAAGPSMTFQREGATATLLPNGKVIIAGGRDSTATLTGTDLYDTVTNLITTGPQMNVARYDCAAALLPNGKVLIAGGFG